MMRYDLVRQTRPTGIYRPWWLKIRKSFGFSHESILISSKDLV